MMSIHAVEVVRKDVVEQLLSVKTVANAFPVWQPRLREIVLGGHGGMFGGEGAANPDTILSIAPQLREVFQLTNENANRSSAEGDLVRSQKSLSGGGAAWEALVAYYLNLVTIGTNAVIYKKQSTLPRPIRDCLTVQYGNTPANTESDLVAVTYPDDESLTMPDFLGGNKKDAYRLIETIADRRFTETLVTVIQCKTNWNDNAQVPMLWDMVYKAEHSNGDVVVGSNNRHPGRLSKFSYAFVTMPSQKNTVSFKPTSMPVKRVNALSGGNYWGMPTKPGVANDLSSIFPKAQIGPERGTGVRESLERELTYFSERYDYFRLGI